FQHEGSSPRVCYAARDRLFQALHLQGHPLSSASQRGHRLLYCGSHRRWGCSSDSEEFAASRVYARTCDRPVCAGASHVHSLGICCHHSSRSYRPRYGSEPMTYIVEAQNVGKTFGRGRLQVRALNSVSLSLEAGELTLLMGPSGSGKTTLLAILGCMLTP